MAIQTFGQRVAEPGAPDIERMPERPQRIADAARGRGFLVQHDQDWQQRLQPRLNGRSDRRCGSFAGEMDGFGAEFDRRRRHRLFFLRLSSQSYLSIG
jgi:hypothetical protein